MNRFVKIDKDTKNGVLTYVRTRYDKRQEIAGYVIVEQLPIPQFSELENCGEFIEYRDGKAWTRYEVTPKSDNEILSILRKKRDEELLVGIAYAQRYNTQKDAGVPTNQSESEYYDLCIYLQSLRDVPEKYLAEGITDLPIKPSFIK